MEEKEILMQNPNSQAPQNVLDSQVVLSVDYFGFDGQIHSGQIVVNKIVAEDVRSFFKLALHIKFPIEKVIPIGDQKYKWDDDVSCADNNSSGFNYRLVAGTNRLSKHSTGMAFDINPVQNLYVRFDENLKEIFKAPVDGVYDQTILGTLTSDHPLVVLMKSLGWDWGGDWTAESGRIDYQHFEKKG
ncbi:MAG: hypothetical protein A2566_00295 [Candidatus Zambryskibacteria bacterium RIFOXYD1_FULL_40_13]|nr:MAG: hypothetical protein UT25_C0004G0044 [Parcubacteria group bacterium GW2011_GWC1_39_12]KKR19124.1 MAG: hypothetical protein UT49_C0003G0044 [Parcubacteria group bacterium GW2011_GWF1_39_37]KKR51887.1 MAG: hypothetical protein UT89_C0005G0044 [Parcubacteria group bacterium GW2011_GWE1_40_20]KKR80500.1 MAG: hypothetical protein UU27_C0027G0005 [Parcubacteria group bacterium GW2011_GWD1_40_9]KKS35775.1 MAG: hypothetical protein UU99_C0004G0044 [Parcubacteria group bacterium GW2011_GWE2_42_1